MEMTYTLKKSFEHSDRHGFHSPVVCWAAFLHSVDAVAYIRVLYTQGVHNLLFFRSIIFFNYFSHDFMTTFISHNYVIFHFPEMPLDK